MDGKMTEFMLTKAGFKSVKIIRETYRRGRLEKIIFVADGMAGHKIKHSASVEHIGDTQRLVVEEFQ